MDVIWLPNFAASGWLQDLSGRISPQELAEFLDREVESGRYQERLYRIPFRSDAGVLFYRKDLLTQTPKTFTQLQHPNSTVTVSWLRCAKIL